MTMMHRKAKNNKHLTKMYHMISKDDNNKFTINRGSFGNRAMTIETFFGKYHLFSYLFLYIASYTIFIITFTFHRCGRRWSRYHHFTFYLFLSFWFMCYFIIFESSSKNTSIGTSNTLFYFSCSSNNLCLKCLFYTNEWENIRHTTWE